MLAHASCVQTLTYCMWFRTYYEQVICKQCVYAHVCLFVCLFVLFSLLFPLSSPRLLPLASFLFACLSGYLLVCVFVWVCGS